MKSDCIFCKIANKMSGQYDNQVIYDDGIFIGMLNSYPQTVGHTIIFTKEHFSELGEMSDIAPTLMAIVLKISEKLIKILNAKAYVLKLNNKLYKLENHPLHVGHIHMHIIPRYTPTENINSEPKQADATTLIKLKNKIADKIKE